MDSWTLSHVAPVTLRPAAFNWKWAEITTQSHVLIPFSKAAIKNKLAVHAKNNQSKPLIPWKICYDRRLDPWNKADPLLKLEWKDITGQS